MGERGTAELLECGGGLGGMGPAFRRASAPQRLLPGGESLIHQKITSGEIEGPRAEGRCDILDQNLLYTQLLPSRFSGRLNFGNDTKRKNPFSDKRNLKGTISLVALANCKPLCHGS